MQRYKYTGWFVSYEYRKKLDRKSFIPNTNDVRPTAMVLLEPLWCSLSSSSVPVECLYIHVGHIKVPYYLNINDFPQFYSFLQGL